MVFWVQQNTTDAVSYIRPSFPLWPAYLLFLILPDPVMKCDQFRLNSPLEIYYL